MNIHGQKEGGEYGVMTEDDLKRRIAQLLPPGVDHSHATHLAGWVAGHPGHGGDGGTVRTYKGHQVFHYTCHGNAKGGAAVFIAEVAFGVGVLVAVGRHTPRGTTTYHLSWGNSGWGGSTVDIA